MKIKNLIYLLSLFIFCSCNKDNDIYNDKSAPQITLNRDTLNFTSLGFIKDENAITVSCNGDWRLTGKKTWCKPSKIAGINGDKVFFNVEPNTELEARSVTYTFICGVNVAKITIYQAGKHIFELSSDKVLITDSEQNIQIIKIKTNVNILCEVLGEAKDWISIADKRDSHGRTFMTFNIAENTAYNDRIGKISFSDPEGLKDTITIYQQQKDIINIEKKTYDVIESGGSIFVNIESNIDYKISIPEECSNWINHHDSNIQTRTLANRKERFEISPSKITRVGNIQFTSYDGKITTNIRIVQKGSSPIYAKFPDNSLKFFLLKTGYILEDEKTNKCELTEKGQKATSLYLADNEIKSIEGIEFFENLRSLTCSRNNLTSIDISRNILLQELYCSDNPLSRITLGNSKVSEIDLRLNGLKGSNGITITGVNLTSLICFYNDDITFIDISDCPKLKYADIFSCKKLETLYLRKNHLSIEGKIDENIKRVYKD